MIDALAGYNIAVIRGLSGDVDVCVREYLAGNLCRCTGYQSQYRALVSYFEIEEAD